MPTKSLNFINRKCNQGGALISALFIMTLVAIAATAMSTRLQLDIYRTRLTINNDKLYLASQAVTFWAMDKLSKENLQVRINNKEGKLLTFPSSLRRLYPDVSIKGEVYDLQGRFNLNNLQDKIFIPIFLRLLETSLKNTDNNQIRALIASIQYWISPYQPGRGHDEYLTYYQKQHPPYSPSYQFMQSVSEFRLVRGVNKSIYQTLLPDITVLPETTPINLNTASKELLKTLGNGLSESQVEEILNARINKGITTSQQLGELLQKIEIPTQQITIESTYYLCTATVSSQDLNLTIYTVIKRFRDQKQQLSVGIVSESINTM